MLGDHNLSCPFSVHGVYAWWAGLVKHFLVVQFNNPVCCCVCVATRYYVAGLQIRKRPYFRMCAYVYIHMYVYVHVCACMCIIIMWTMHK